MAETASIGPYISLNVYLPKKLKDLLFT